MPVLVIGATGPVDAAKRRPWIDWIHTARDQGAIVRGYTKWDDQPASPAAAREALLRASWIAERRRKGPVYVMLDAGMQEAELDAPLPPDDPPLHAAACALSRRAGADRPRCANRCWRGKQPVILAGPRVAQRGSMARARRARRGLGARVVTDLKVGAAFPTDHPLHAGAPGILLDARAAAGAARGRRHPEPRLGRSRRHAQGGVRRREADRAK